MAAHSLACRGAVRISPPVAVKIGKLRRNKLRRLPDFKGERIAPPPIYAPVAGEKCAAHPLWVSHGSAKAKPGLAAKAGAGLLGRGRNVAAHSLACRGAVRISSPGRC